MKRIFLSKILLAFVACYAMLGVSGCLVETCGDCMPPPPPPPPPPCSYGPNGYAGPAFFGVDYTCCQPTYVWTNNTAIPPTFHYGEYYNSLPGNYRLYYEGRFLNGCCYTEYYWDVNFDVWVNAGTLGGCGYAGVNGLPSYLMLVCTADGPGQSRTNKIDAQGITTTVVSEHKNEVIVLYEKGDIHVRVTYRRLAESIKRQLDPAGVVRGE